MMCGNVMVLLESSLKDMAENEWDYGSREINQ